MSMTGDTLDFPLDQDPKTATQVYRPWGTRTLKVKVSTSKTMPALRIRPQGVRPEEAEKGVFRAFADDSDAFIISWGGGHEPGPCIQSKDFLKAFEQCAPMEAGQTSMIFFNLSHVGPGIPDEAKVTLEAYDEESGEVKARLPIRIQKPDLPLDAVKFEETEAGVWRPVGDKLPTYDPRWWPRPVAYVATEQTDEAGSLPLSIHRVGLSLQVQWAGEVVATITDHTEPSILDTEDVSFELFDFDEWHVALRTWFFWLDKTVGGDFFVGRHEVPDAERFDFLIRKRDGLVTFACTDLHWRETWGQVRPQEMVQATIGLGLETTLDLAREQMEKLWSVWKREKKVDHTRPYNPLAYIERAAESAGKERAGKLRAKGTEAH